jgi:hypothetical protein
MLKGFYLSLFMGPPTSPQPVPREVVDALQSVSVTQAAGQRSGFQLVFATSKQSKIQRELLPSGFFDPVTTRVQIVVTVGGQATTIMDGIIARHEVAPGKDPGTSLLTITGEDVSLAMDLIDLTGLPYPCMPFEARVALALAKYAIFGVIPLIIPSVLVDIPNPLDEIPSHSGTDLAYITALADEVGYVFYTYPGPTRGMNFAYWGPEIRWGSTQPALTVDSDAATNVEQLTFSYDGTGGTLFTFMVQIPQTEVSIPIPVPSIGLLRPPLAAKPALPLKMQQLTDTVNKGPIRAAAIALAKAARAQDTVTGQGSLDVLRYGRVLQSRSLVDVRGAGRAYDGTYYVSSVTHSIKRGEYKQSFSLSREGLNPLKNTVVTS